MGPLCRPTIRHSLDAARVRTQRRAVNVRDPGNAATQEKKRAEPAEEEAVEEAMEKPSGESEASLMKLKKDELVERAKAAGVASSGTKADIVARLLE